MKTYLTIILMCLSTSVMADTALNEKLLTQGWRFHRGEAVGAESVTFNDADWQQVRVPHDWAIGEEFNRENDIQCVMIKENGEEKPTWHTGRSGGLPWAGVGWYRTTFNTKPGTGATLLFDGAMSEALVYVNGKKAIFWPCGYNSFFVDVTALLNKDGKANVLAVRLNNREQSSRWYPGAGIYRNVHLIEWESDVRIPVWGMHVTTPHIKKDYATVTNDISIEGADEQELTVSMTLSYKGKVVASTAKKQVIHEGIPLRLNTTVEHPHLWSPESPELYLLDVKVEKDSKLLDSKQQRVGIRSIEYIAEKGFFLNGEKRQFRGVCNHHDLGPLGAAVNESALRHQLQLLKDMGCDAIRTSHNMPAPDLVELCDEMGFMMMVEPFDEWDVAKCDSGYHRFFNEWAERDMENMVRHYRNNPSVVMWSIGNEVPSQVQKGGTKVAAMLRDICHKLDPTRPVTAGMDRAHATIWNGFGALLDIPGFNYRTELIPDGHKRLPQGFILGSETASTVSSRGIYKFPVELKKSQQYDDHQSSGYDTEACFWSNIPDVDFALADDNEWYMGQFVWTGFDYLGEPTPYDTNGWPNHSSLFGIIDLASLPKDRYYLYQSVWNHTHKMLHVLPHWTWPGRIGEITPVMAYSNYLECELLVNGESMGRLHKLTKEECLSREKAGDKLAMLRRYRFIWDNVKYEPGEITVKAYDETGKLADTKTIRTAGKPHHLRLTTDRESLKANGLDIAYITVEVVDKDGNVCPHASDLVSFKVEGEGHFCAAANGDPTCLDRFQLPRHHVMAGKLSCLIESNESAGAVTLKASAGKLKGQITIPVKK